jgi:phosphate transport system substrate-binding protein
LKELSLREVQDIFSGRLLNWQEIDGPALPIQVVSREDGSGTGAVFEAAVMEDSPVTPTAIVLPSSQAVVDFVAQNSNAIGYVSLSFIDNRVYAVPIEGVTPNLKSLISGNYFLTRELALITPKQSQPEVNHFIEFVLSPAGQAIVEEGWAKVR